MFISQVTLTATDLTDPTAPVIKFEKSIVDNSTKFEYIRDIYANGSTVYAVLIVRNRKEYDGFIVWSRYVNWDYNFDAVVVDISAMFA